VVAVALLLGGCGADDPEETRVSARSYVTDVCGAVTEWNDDVQALTQELQGAMEDPADLETVKETTVTFLDESVAATERMLTDVGAAGIPDVPDGEEAARRVTAALGDVRDVIAAARDRVEGLSTADPEGFATELQAVSSDLQTSLQDVVGTLESFEVPELEEAADDVPACDELAA